MFYRLFVEAFARKTEKNPLENLSIPSSSSSLSGALQSASQSWVYVLDSSRSNESQPESSAMESGNRLESTHKQHIKNALKILSDFDDDGEAKSLFEREKEMKLL